MLSTLFWWTAQFASICFSASVFYQDLFGFKWTFSCASNAWNWTANKYKLWKGNTFFSFLNQCNCNRRKFRFFGIDFFVYFVEVIFLIVDRVHAGRLYFHHIAFAWCSLIYFYAEQIILVNFFHNTAESSKRMNIFGCTEHVTTCMLITHLSFSERAHTKKIKFWIKKIRVVRQRRSNSSGFSHAGYSTAKQTSRFLSLKRVGIEIESTWHSKIKKILLY